MEDASKFIAQGPAVFTNPLPNNQNMNLRTIDHGCASSGNQNPLEATIGNGCINMMSVAKVVTRTKDYGLSQSNLGKEPSPPENPLHIEKPTYKPEALPLITKGVLENSGHNHNA